MSVPDIFIINLKKYFFKKLVKVLLYLSTKSCLLYFVLCIFLTPVFSDQKVRDCEEIDNKDGYFFLRYTFIKYTGSCSEYETDEKIKKIKNYINGEADGEFKTYIDGIIHKEYFMKKNFLHGLYLEYINGKVVKRIIYNEGEISSCDIDLSYIVNKKNELIVMKQKKQSGTEILKIIDEIGQKTRLLDNYMKLCRLVEVLN